MPELYPRLLLWHKLVAMQTGGMALCSVKRKLNREEFKGWSTTLRNVADDIDAFLDTGSFILDDKGQRVVQSGTDRANPQTSEREAQHEVADIPKSPDTRAVSRKAGGLRVATRKTK